MKEKLYAYIGGIVREIGGTLIEINAMPGTYPFLCIHAKKPYRLQNLWRLLRQIHQNGFMAHFQTKMILDGRRDMGHFP